MRMTWKGKPISELSDDELSEVSDFVQQNAGHAVSPNETLRTAFLDTKREVQSEHENRRLVEEIR